MHFVLQHNYSLKYNSKQNCELNFVQKEMEFANNKEKLSEKSM